MMRRITGLLLTVLVALMLFYLSRFWDFRLWQGGLFGIDWLRPQGNLVARWLRGTPFASYDLLIWAVCSVLILTFLERGFARFWPLPPPPRPE